MSRSADASLTIGTVAERTGTSVALLRAWEQRYGFPQPTRSGSGHRRYRERDVEQIRQVQRDRAAGLSIEAAVQRLTPLEPSIFAGLRRHRPDLVPHVLSKRTMQAISHAIEDEYGTDAARPLVIAAFQEERFWRASEPRYRDLARTAGVTVALADFAAPPERGGVPAGRPVEVALAPDDALLREWAVVCTGSTGGACLAGRERPGRHGAADHHRVFEAFWSVEPDVVGTAADIALGIARRLRPDLAADLPPTPPPPAPGDEALRRAIALTNRIVAYVEHPRQPGKRRA
jgi:DICT domain-containing protein